MTAPPPTLTPRSRSPRWLVGITALTVVVAEAVNLQRVAVLAYAALVIVPLLVGVGTPWPAASGAAASRSRSRCSRRGRGSLSW